MSDTEVTKVSVDKPSGLPTDKQSKKKKTKPSEGPSHVQIFMNNDPEMDQKPSTLFKDAKKSGISILAKKSISFDENKKVSSRDVHRPIRRIMPKHTLQDILGLRADSSEAMFMSKQKQQLDKRMKMFLAKPQKILSTRNVYDSATIFAKREKHLKCDMFVTTESEVKDFLIETLHVLGVNDEKAGVFATALTEADKRGYTFEGLASFSTHILDITGKISFKNSSPKILAETISTAWVDGNRALGPVLGKYCIELAMSKAAKVGVGIVAVNNVTSTGHGVWITSLAKERGYIGMKFANARPKMCPVGSLKAALGDNNLSFTAPAGYDHFHVEVTTTALSKEILTAHLNNNTPLYGNFGYGTDGKLSRNPHEIYQARRLLPLGLTRAQGSIKGYGLGIIVEVLCGMLSSSTYGPFLKKFYELDNESMNYGQCYIVLDPKCFCLDFETRLAKFLDEIRNLPPLKKSKPVITPGELENYCLALREKQSGMVYPKSVVEATKFIAERLHISRLKFKTLRF